MISQQERERDPALTSLSPDDVSQQVQTFVLLGQRSLLLRSHTLSLHSESSEETFETLKLYNVETLKLYNFITL